MKNDITNLISFGKIIEIPACDGNRKIYQESSLFRSGIDHDLKKLTLPGIITENTQVEVREMFKDGDFLAAFEGIPTDWNYKWLSQEQVINFRKQFPNWLRLGGNCTFVLIKKNEQLPFKILELTKNLAVLQIYVRGDSCSVSVRELDHPSIWKAKDRHRLIVPRQWKY